MKRYSLSVPRLIRFFVVIIIGLVLVLSAGSASAGEDLYQDLSRAAGDPDLVLFKALAVKGQALDWSAAKPVEFEGNLRFLETGYADSDDQISGLFLVRRLDGELFILSMPVEASLPSGDSEDYYSGLQSMLGDKLVFKALVAEGEVNGKSLPKKQRPSFQHSVFLPCSWLSGWESSPMQKSLPIPNATACSFISWSYPSLCWACF